MRLKQLEIKKAELEYENFLIEHKYKTLKNEFDIKLRVQLRQVEQQFLEFKIIKMKLSIN
jgi:hypothetical protein